MNCLYNLASKKCRFMFAMAMMLACPFAFARTVQGPRKGIVVDDYGNAIAGVVITVKGTDVSVKSDAAGMFDLPEQQGVLSVDHPAYYSQEFSTARLQKGIALPDAPEA